MRKNSNRFKRKNKRDYNCGGYALGTYDWFLPYSCSYSDEYLEDDNKSNDSQAYKGLA